MPGFAITRQRRRRRPSDKPKYTAKQWKLGEAAERRFFEAVESPDMRYSEGVWDVTAANTEQNQNGFDFSVSGDFGRLYVNVKYHESAVKNFHARENRRLIPCLVIDSNDTNRVIISKLNDLIAKLRREIFEHRREVATT